MGRGTFEGDMCRPIPTCLRMSAWRTVRLPNVCRSEEWKDAPMRPFDKLLWTLVQYCYRNAASVRQRARSAMKRGTSGVCVASLGRCIACRIPVCRTGTDADNTHTHITTSRCHLLIFGVFSSSSLSFFFFFKWRCRLELDLQCVRQVDPPWHWLNPV